MPAKLLAHVQIQCGTALAPVLDTALQQGVRCCIGSGLSATRAKGKQIEEQGQKRVTDNNASVRSVGRGKWQIPNGKNSLIGCGGRGGTTRGRQAGEPKKVKTGKEG